MIWNIHYEVKNTPILNILIEFYFMFGMRCRKGDTIMSKFRKLLTLMLAMVLAVGCAGLGETYAASTKYRVPETTVAAGHTATWRPTTDPDGIILTSGGTQEEYFKVTTRGNKMKFGFKKNSTGVYYSWYDGTLSGTSKTASKQLAGLSGYYKIVFSNKNATVQIKITNSSYALVK